MRAGGDWIEADQVILACPAWSAAALAGGIDARACAELLGRIPYSSSLTLSLIYQAAEFDGKRAGFGFLVPKRERQRLAACTFVGTKFPLRAPDDRILLRCFFGGIGDEAILKESDESLVAIAREELRRILGLTAAPVFHTISRWPRSMAQYTVGHAARVKEIRDRAGGDSRAASGRQRLRGHRHPGLHSHRPRARRNQFCFIVFVFRKRFRAVDCPSRRESA